MRLLVTGIAGFIGSQLAERLLGRGHAVVGIDNFDPFYDRAIKEQNLAAIRPHAEVIEGDVLDAALLDATLARDRFDAIVHLAALAGVGPSLAAPARYQRVNGEGTAVVAEAAAKRSVPGVVFASSSSVYGGNTKVPFEESDRVDDPVSPYAASKRAAELALRSAQHTTGIGVTVLRYFTVYGPRQRPDMAVAAFCGAIERGAPVRLRGGGKSSRDYTYVDDIVDGTIAAIERLGAGYRVYNLGGSRATSLEALVQHLARALGKEARIESAPAALGDVEHTLASVSRAEAELGYAPAIGIEEGIARYVAWRRRAGA
jgi:UDP-glucuronate 4-epimerase